MATAKKTAKKAVTRPAPKAEKKMQLVAVVMERKHLFFPLQHSHYEVNIIEIDDALSVEMIEEAAENAARIVREKTGTRLRFLTAQKVEIATQEYIDKKVNELKEKISKEA